MSCCGPLPFLLRLAAASVSQSRYSSRTCACCPTSDEKACRQWPFGVLQLTRRSSKSMRVLPYRFSFSSFHLASWLALVAWTRRSSYSSGQYWEQKLEYALDVSLEVVCDVLRRSR